MLALHVSNQIFFYQRPNPISAVSTAPGLSCREDNSTKADDLLAVAALGHGGRLKLGASLHQISSYQ
jgi:hypothetical protein